MRGGRPLSTARECWCTAPLTCYGGVECREDDDRLGRQHCADLARLDGHLSDGGGDGRRLLPTDRLAVRTTSAPLTGAQTHDAEVRVMLQQSDKLLAHHTRAAQHSHAHHRRRRGGGGGGGWFV